jgi:macrolide transport system ATP-binding/permease protein
MNSLLLILRKIKLLVTRERFDKDLAEEMAFHRDQKANEFQANGLTPQSARYAAEREFGNHVHIKEQSQEIVSFQFETAWQDVRYALRQLRKHPGFASITILILALGMCASISIFAFVDAALIKPLPYPNPTRLVDVTGSIAMLPRADLSYLDYLDWKKLNTVFSSMDVHHGSGYLLRTGGGTEVVPGVRVSAGFFRTLGITPILGRDFHSGEDGPEAPATAMLSYGTWQKRFGGRTDVIGQTISLGDTATTVIGVLPETFEFAPQGNAEVWSNLQPSDDCSRRRGCHNFFGIARLKDGVSVQAARAEMKLIAINLEKQYPDSNRGQGASVLPLSEVIIGDIRPIMLTLLAGAGLLLLIGCANVASLLLVRSDTRKREVAVRAALGASPARLIRQFVTEGLVLVAGSSIFALLSAYIGIQLLTTLIPRDRLAGMPFLRDAGLNFHVLTFAAVIALIAAIVFAITPAAHLPLARMREGLAESGRAAGMVWRRLGSNLVVLELALAMVLLVSAGLLGKSLYRLLHVDLGFQADHLATLRISAPESDYGKAQQALALDRTLVTRLSALPGVKSVALTSVLPVSFNGNTVWIRILGHPFNGEHNEVSQRIVSSDYFTTLQARLQEGRYFTDAEDSSKPGVLLINRAFAKQYFPNEDPIGKKIAHYDMDPSSIREVIGIVDDIKDGPLDSDIWPTLYRPVNQDPRTSLSVVARTSQNEKALLPTLNAAIHEIDRNIATRDQATMEDRIDSSQSAYLHRSSAWLVGGFAGLALLLGVVGLYGVIAYSVSQRTREIGIRMAMGAERSSVYRMILKEAGWLTVLGIVTGLLCSLAAATLIRKLLFGTQAWDLPTLLSVAAILGLSALLASYLPARRAASVNPMEALRAE